MSRRQKSPAQFHVPPCIRQSPARNRWKYQAMTPRTARIRTIRALRCVRFMGAQIGAESGQGKEEGAMKEDMLARLVAQADGAGAMGGDMVMIRALVEEASDLGAQRALERLGLADRRAQGDVRELRELLSAWRDAKKAARGALIGWAVRIALAMLLLGIAVKLGFLGLVKA